MKDLIFKRIDEEYPKYVKILEDICNIESQTCDKEGVDAVGNYLIALARERGWQIRVHEETAAGNAICFTLNGEVDAAPVVFSSHMDTVHPKGLFGYPPTKIDGNIIKGPGVSDCKGGIVCALLAMDMLEAAGYKKRPLKLVLQSDEETGSLESKKRTIKFMAECSYGAVAFLNGEPATDYEWLTVERKGIIRYVIDVTGKAAHSSLCQDGINAIAVASKMILDFERHKDKEGITANCGVIKGGTVENTVAERCSFAMDFRFRNHAEYEAIKNEVKEAIEKAEKSGATVNAKIKSERVSMPICEMNNRLFEKIKAIYEDCSLGALNRNMRPGGSDAAYMTERGIPSVCSIGIRGGNIHSQDEFAYISSIPDCAKRLCAIALYIED